MRNISMLNYTNCRQVVDLWTNILIAQQGTSANVKRVHKKF